MTTVKTPVRRRPGTRARIADTALALFSTRGFDGASMRELADRLDMTPAALYYHYVDKADILVHLVEPMFTDVERLVAATEQVHGDIGTRLARVLDLLLEYRDVFILLTTDVTARSHPAISERLADTERRLFRFTAGGTAPRSAESVIRAVAAVGAMARPIVVLDDLDVGAHRDLLLTAALSAYHADRGAVLPAAAGSPSSSSQGAAVAPKAVQQ